VETHIPLKPNINGRSQKFLGPSLQDYPNVAKKINNEVTFFLSINSMIF
jgi:hypothetical protein